MLQFLLPFLAMMGMGGGSAAGAGGLAGLTGAAPSLAAMGGGTLASMGAAAPEAAIAAGTASAVPASWTIGSRLAPNLSSAGSSLMSGNIANALKNTGGAVGNMMGSPNLANMLSNPSWANLGKLGEGMGDKMVAKGMTNALMGTPQQQQQMTMGPGSLEKKVQVAPPSAITQDPVLQRMYNNLIPQFQAQPMKPWPPSPYPRRMSPV